MSWTEFKTLVTSRFTPKYANIRAGVAWLDLGQTHSIKAYVGKFQGIVSTLQHVADYNKQLKFIHGLQPWARKLIFRMPQLSDNLQDLMRMAERLGDDAVDKKEPGGEVKLAKVGKDRNSWQERKKRKKDKHVHEKFEPKPNNAPKGGKSKPWEARKPPKDKDAYFGCGKKGHMKKDCPKVVSASTPSERLKPLLGGGFVAKASLRIGCGNPGLGLMFLQGRINDQHISMLVDTGASHSFMSPQMVKSLGLFPMRVDNPIKVRFAKGEPQVAGRVVGNVLIECGTWKGEESFTICEMDDIDVVLGLTFLEAYNGVFKGKKRELVVQSDGREFVLPLTKSSGAFGGRLNFISARELSEKCYMLVMRAGEAGDGGHRES